MRYKSEVDALAEHVEEVIEILISHMDEEDLINLHAIGVGICQRVAEEFKERLKLREIL
ncbi:hypothetical protein [Methanocaldococcus vulcanius]|nr:hypothetical protein [Methanocaldococcus vulcanius]